MILEENNNNQMLRKKEDGIPFAASALIAIEKKEAIPGIATQIMERVESTSISLRSLAFIDKVTTSPSSAALHAHLVEGKDGHT